MRKILLSIFLLCLPTWAHAVTYYVDIDGSDANPGTKNAPWLTWVHAFAKSDCGDTLIVMDGTYTRATHGAFVLKKTCTKTTVFTIRSENERQAFIDGDGTTFSLRVVDSAYVTIEGLRVKSLDNSSGVASSTVQVRSSDHVTLRRLLVSHNNRYFNTHLIELNRSSNVLVEETEMYHFHRHGILLYNTNNSIMRRNYCHARSHAAVPGGYNGTSGDNGTGDDCIAVYPGDQNIIENNISDGTMLKAFAVQATGMGIGNKFYGNIALGPLTIGLAFEARTGTGENYMPRDNYVENQVVINATNVGIWFRGNKNAICNNCMVINSNQGLVVDSPSATPGDGIYSFFSINSLVIGSKNRGWSVNGAIQTWRITNPNAFGNDTNYTPPSSSNWVTKTTVDAALGTCKVWVPDASPMKGAGVNRADIGANILYRYENGALTKSPLWDRSTGEFPHGAVVAGLNDVAGQSLSDVHKRLNVNSNGCSFPASYRNGVSTEPAAPADLRVS